ncbi:class C sortase [Longicatena caecimuris]
MVSVCFVFVFLFFLGIMDYPFVSRLINQRNYDGVIIEYDDTSAKLDENRKEQFFKEAKQYNEELSNGSGISIIDAFAQDHSMEKKYTQLLNVANNGVMGVVDIPKLHVSLPIYHGTSEEVLQKGAGHLEGTSLPIGGISTHACLSAHRGLPNKKMFTSLDELKEGDIFLITVLGRKMAYKVNNIQIVLPSDIKALHIQKDKDLVTLITCTPYGVNSHRLYVTGERTEYKEEMKTDNSIGLPWYYDWWWVPVNIVLLSVLGILLYQYNRKPKVKEKVE